MWQPLVTTLPPVSPGLMRLPVQSWFQKPPPDAYFR